MRAEGTGEIELPEIILASSSPRRRELLRQIGVRFHPIAPMVEEVRAEGEPPEDFVRRLSMDKAASIASEHPDRIVLGSDTIVLLGREILGKPVDPEDAIRMLRLLSGNTHEVLTGYSLIRRTDGTQVTGIGRAEVTFRDLEEDEIRAYVAGGSPMDKAGSYGIQEDLGAVFIDRIVGDYYTIVGLPLRQVYLSLREISIGKA